ncbi:MAG TPA: enterochelin esterase, partial [Microlunatus sp.]|nr:enterochelin esterase [Microlunatus sp.]
MARRRKLAINRLRESKHLDQQTLERFIDRHEFPIVEGTTTTFVAWQQHADEVFVRHRVVGVADPLPMRRITNTDLFYVVVEIPRDSRVEYQIEKRRGDHWERFNDPLNPHTARSPVGDSSVCYGYGYQVPDWATYDPEARPGELVELMIRSQAQRRDNRVTLYLPARFRTTTRYPLLVVHDGGDFLEYASMKIVLDNLIHRLDM